MKMLLFVTLGFVSATASAGTLNCQLLKAQGGRVVAESVKVQVQGNVEIQIDDFAKTDGVTARISGAQQDELQLSIDEAQSGISVVTAYSPNNSLNLMMNNTRFALVCLPK